MDGFQSNTWPNFSNLYQLQFPSYAPLAVNGVSLDSLYDTIGTDTLSSKLTGPELFHDPFYQLLPQLDKWQTRGRLSSWKDPILITYLRPESKYLSLIRASNQKQKEGKTGLADPIEVQAIYDGLKPIEPDFLIGKWTGGGIDTGHPVNKLLGEAKWAGKDFRTVDDVDPIMVYNDKGERVFFEERGHAQVRESRWIEGPYNAIISPVA